MSSSYTTSDTATFTLTHAKYLASKVRTDLMRMHHLYGGVPTVSDIDAYEEELTALLKAGYVSRVTYGFKRNGSFISPSLKYEAHELAAGDDRPGKVPRGEDVSGAHFSSYLAYSAKWGQLSPAEKKKFKEDLPVNRVTAEEPGVDGYYSTDKTYSAGGTSMSRSVVRNY